jgi:hypothetical protein
MTFAMTALLPMSAVIPALAMAALPPTMPAMVVMLLDDNHFSISRACRVADGRQRKAERSKGSKRQNDLTHVSVLLWMRAITRSIEKAFHDLL